MTSRSTKSNVVTWASVRLPDPEDHAGPVDGRRAQDRIRFPPRGRRTARTRPVCGPARRARRAAGRALRAHRDLHRGHPVDGGKREHHPVPYRDPRVRLRHHGPQPDPRDVVLREPQPGDLRLGGVRPHRHVEGRDPAAGRSARRRPRRAARTRWPCSAGPARPTRPARRPGAPRRPPSPRAARRGRAAASPAPAAATPDRQVAARRSSAIPVIPVAHPPRHVTWSCPAGDVRKPSPGRRPRGPAPPRRGPGAGPRVGRAHRGGPGGGGSARAAEQVGVHDPALAGARLGPGRADAAGDLGDRARDEDLVRRAQVGAQ